jgi:hypothetical protein
VRTRFLQRRVRGLLFAARQDRLLTDHRERCENVGVECRDPIECHVAPGDLCDRTHSKTSRVKGLQELDELERSLPNPEVRRHAAQTSVGAFCQNGLNRAAASEHSDLRRRGARWTAAEW